jgi:uncharacterized cupin superfamily protein
MAGFKVSEFSGVADTTDDSLLLLSYTTDAGASYATRKIRIADFLNDIDPTTKADLDVDDLETLVGAGAGAQNLGTFPGDIIPDNTTVKQALLLLEQNVALKQATVTAGNGLAFTGATLDIDLASGSEALSTFTLSGMSDSNHNDTYYIVDRSGTKLKGLIRQSGSSIELDIEREAPFTITISGTTLAAANSTDVSVRGEHNGYLTRSGDVFTWNIGQAPVNSLRHFYYYNPTTQIFVAYNNTDVEWTVFDLSVATNATDFIADLVGGSGSTLYYISGGESFTATSAQRATLSNASTTYPGESILYVPSDGGNVTYAAASEHPYYIYQNAAGNKWVAFDDNNYWTAYYRTAVFDLETEVLTDDQVAFSLDSSSAFEFITTASDDFGDGVNIPDAAASEVTYIAASSDSYLEFSSGGLAVKVKDEDDMVSNSADHVPTQQSVKAYVDAQNTLDATTAAATYLRIDGATAATGALDMGGNRVTNQAEPVSGSDSATKLYVDTATAGQGAFWTPVDVQADSNITLSGEQTIDGVLTSASRVLVSGQTDASENGIYVSAAGAWARATDANESSEFLENKTVFIKLGTTKSGHVVAYTATDSPTIGTTDLTFVTKSEAATLADGSITTAKLADLAVTNAKINDLDASKLTGTIADARIPASGVTQHQGALSVAFTQLTGSIANAQVPSTAVTQHQGSLSLTKSQISDFSDADYFSATLGTITQIEQGSIRQSLGTASSATSLGTFTGSIIPDSATVKSALQAVETEIESLAIADLTDGANVVEAGDNVNRLIGSTGADGEPASYLFVVVDQADGALKFIDKTFIEIE